MLKTNFGDLVEVMAKALVDDPDAVEIEEVEEGNALVVELRVSPHDIGKVIGKAGRTAEAMRILLHAASNKVGRRVHLDILG